jgi:hypothetical protein
MSRLDDLRGVFETHLVTVKQAVATRPPEEVMSLILNLFRCGEILDTMETRKDAAKSVDISVRNMSDEDLAALILSLHHNPCPPST